MPSHGLSSDKPVARSNSYPSSCPVLGVHSSVGEIFDPVFQDENAYPIRRLLFALGIDLRAALAPIAPVTPDSDASGVAGSFRQGAYRSRPSGAAARNPPLLPAG